MTTMTQCRLERPTAFGVEYQVAWIETKFAKVGKIVDIDEASGRDKGWRVARVGSTQDAKTVQERSRDYRKHREATDV